jgi:hypothetical protein
MESTIRAVVFKEGDWWIIHGLDYDFATAARRLEDVPAVIQHFLTVLVAASQQLGVEPFYGYSPAPRRYWKMYEQAQPWTGPFPPIELAEEIGPLPLVDTRLAA